MSETDRRLKDHLNTNQAKRERMCLEILTVQDGYTELQPRLPKGGPDGGRDIQGLFRGDLFFGAVGFVNDATDTNQHRKQIQGKFSDDLDNALKSNPDKPTPKGFVFLTNVGLTPGIIADLQRSAYERRVSYCEILDRERLRIILDSNRGYAIRLRYLDIPLSDAEQKDFFSAWADGITSLIGSGKGIDQTTKRIQFLLESQLLLDDLSVIVKLDSPIWEACKGEFLFQTTLTLRVHSQGLVGFSFGGGTKTIVESPDEEQARGQKLTRNSQYGFGFSWIMPETEQHLPFKGTEDKQEYPKGVARTDTGMQYIRTSGSSAILEAQRNILHFTVLSEPFLFRFEPTCKLLELHGSMILFDCNKEIADHISEILIVGGGYELLKLNRRDLNFEKGRYERLKLPKEAKQQADSHEWIIIRPSRSISAFSIDLMHKTPKRYDWD
ncbi:MULTISPECIES: hypothetical protein [unclassified Bradyrhizobium]|uniref:hypothetical protein n=1 Tax=Bradyrhizobium sp. USDA 4541 TaxID=2817704 RepID=UPI0020A346B1|nr:hypothetical protein [Bradyrhizobium sp. USDA 4541]MCP1854232.1 hypothetical protein [Bradyrhizobium sp. USDA 4541]